MWAGCRTATAKLLWGKGLQSDFSQLDAESFSRGVISAESQHALKKTCALALCKWCFEREIVLWIFVVVST